MAEFSANGRSRRSRVSTMTPTLVALMFLMIINGVVMLWRLQQDSPLRIVAGVSILVSASLLALWALGV